MILRIIGGLVLVFIGFIFVWKTEWFQQNVGSISWAEEKMASMGGSRLMYKLIGILVIIIGMLIATNLYRTAFISTFGWLFGIKTDQTEQVDNSYHETSSFGTTQ
jgi:hypothetical protein